MTYILGRENIHLFEEIKHDLNFKKGNRSRYILIKSKQYLNFYVVMVFVNIYVHSQKRSTPLYYEISNECKTH